MDQFESVAIDDRTAAPTESALGLVAGVTSPVSPFAGGGLVMEAAATAVRAPTPSSWLASPFAEGLAGPSEPGEQEFVEAILGELEDEAFDEALEALVDEVAARHVTATTSWSSDREAPNLAEAEAEAWIGRLADQADQLFSHLEVEFAERMADSVTDEEIAAALGPFGSENVVDSASEQFLKSLVDKARRAAGVVAGAAKRGLSALGRMLPLGRLFGLLRRLVRPLLTRVLRTALNRLPATLRGPASELARRLAGRVGQTTTTATTATAATAAATAATAAATADASAADPSAQDPAASAGSELAAEFDRLAAEAIAAPNDAVVDQLEAEATDHLTEADIDVVSELDTARARLATQLAEADPGQPPVAEVEQFIPAVMAALPLVRMGIRVAGRDKVVRFLADRLANLIKGHIGAQAARTLAPPVADIGLRLLSLESETPEGLGAEALVSVVEDTVREVASLPPASLEEPLRVEAELQEAFADAAARYLPRERLRPDLPTFETSDVSGESGVWVLMPRAARPCFRYRKYSRVYRVPIRRAQARAIVLSDEDTLEQRLLDAGVNRWPVEAEVHVYEAVPGTHLGHIAAFEAEVEAEADDRTGGSDASRLATDEFEELTPATAALLLGEAGLGHRVAGPTRSRGLPPGRRLFRIVIPGTRVRRRRRRFLVRLDVGGPKPVLRVHLRLGEREAYVVAERLAAKAHAQVVAMVRALLGPFMQRRLAIRLVRQARRTGAPLPHERAQALAAHLAETMIATVAKQLSAAGAAAALANAARDPASGLTLTFAYQFADRAAIAAGKPDEPTLTIRPGFQRD
jgi:hypothetical protein